MKAKSTNSEAFLILAEGAGRKDSSNRCNCSILSLEIFSMEFDLITISLPYATMAMF